jgi:sorting nexin-29
VAGSDGIHLELIKYGGNKLLNRMYELVRQIWEEERIDEDWKETIIVPIHKRGDRDRCENYKGIALGNEAYKILWNIIFGKITPYIEKVMGDYQKGFRDGRSVTDNIFALKI